MKIRIMFTMLAAAVALALAVPAAAQDKALIEKGVKLYATKNCAMCHSIQGKGNKNGPLDGVGSKLKAEEIRAWIVSPKEMTEKTKAPRKPFMPPTPNVTKEDVDALVAYMLSLKKQ